MIRIDREGLGLACALGAVTVALVALTAGTGRAMYVYLAAPVGVMAVFTLYFFRDPDRTSAAGQDAVVSAADGVVVDVSRAPGDEGETLRIAVFMNVFDVHINRSPVAGTVRGTVHRPGRKLNAMNVRAADENEYGETYIVSAFGTVRIRQIAGLIARRVVTRVQAGDVVVRGGRIGLIRFGSRVDVYLPAVFAAMVREGDRVRAGETVIAAAAPRDPGKG